MTYTTLITGASSGLGLEFAHIAASRGDTIILVARRIEKLRDLEKVLREKYSISTLSIEMDLSNSCSPEKVYQLIQNHGFTIDHLINNAGFGEFGSFADSDWKRQGEMIDLNIRSLTQMTKLFLPSMITRKYGRILNIASTAAFQPGPGMAVYFATKSYVLSFSEALSEELLGTGVTVTALCPGPTESEFATVSGMDMSNLFRGKKLPSSHEVSLYGYNMMLTGKVVAIHGWKNWFLAETVRFTPRWMTRKIIAKMQKKPE